MSDVELYFNKALDFIKIAKDNLKMGHNETAINRSYYAVFYAVNALLQKENKFPKTHNGTRKLFSLIFVKEKGFNKELFDFYSDLFETREDADYDLSSDFDYDETKMIIDNSILFIKECKNYL